MRNKHIVVKLTVFSENTFPQYVSLKTNTTTPKLISKNAMWSVVIIINLRKRVNKKHVFEEPDNMLTTIIRSKKLR